MIFLELVLENFGPYQGRQVINLEPKNIDNPQPIILFGGMNGGGKTTLMDAIRLALYGHRAQCSTRGNLSYSDFLTQCVNSNTPPAASTRIELTYEHIENAAPVKYKIVRTWTKNPKDGKDHLGILDAQDWLDTALANIWDEYIENLLPLGISNLFLFDGEQVKELAEQETPPPIVADAIRGLLGLELAARLAIDLEILVNRKRKALSDIKELAKLEEIEETLHQQQKHYQIIVKQVENLEKDLEIAENYQQEAVNKFIAEGGKIAGERSQLEAQYRQKTTETLATRSHLCELAAGVFPLALIEPLLVQAQAQAAQEERASQAQIARNLLIERDNRLTNLIHKLDISTDNINTIKDFIQQENQAFAQTAQSAAWLFATPETLTQLDNINHQLAATKINAQQQIALLKQQEAEIISLERQLQTAASPEAYQKLVAAVEQAQIKVVEVKAAILAARQRLAELTTAIAHTKKSLAEYTEQSIDRKNNEHIIAVSARVQATLKLFRDRLTLRKLNKLELEVTECFRYLLHKSDLVHRVVIDTHTFSLSLYDLQGLPVAKHRLSAGEKQLLAIAFLWGLARIAGRQLPIAIDTPLGRLDSSHRSNLVERYFPTASHQVILLATDTEIGKAEVTKLRQNNAIAREYLLKYDSSSRQTTVEPGYFW